MALQTLFPDGSFGWWLRKLSLDWDGIHIYYTFEQEKQIPEASPLPLKKEYFQKPLSGWDVNRSRDYKSKLEIIYKKKILRLGCFLQTCTLYNNLSNTTKIREGEK